MTVKQEGDYSTMTEDEYESARDSEFFMWRDKLDDVQHMIYQLEEDRASTVNEYGGNILQPTFDRVTEQLEEVQYRILGRLNELDEDYCTGYWGQERYKYCQAEAEEAYALGINFVAVEHLCSRFDMGLCMGYIKSNGLASLSYEKTCAAVKEFQGQIRQEAI